MPQITKINMAREKDLILTIEQAIIAHLNSRKIQMTSVQVLGCLELIAKGYRNINDEKN